MISYNVHFFVTFASFRVITATMGMPITHIVYMPWHLDDPFTLEQHTMMIFTMIFMKFSTVYMYVLPNSLYLIASENVSFALLPFE